MISDQRIRELREEARLRGEIVNAACAAADEWAALREKMNREPFMPRSTREALDRLAIVTLQCSERKVRP